jgi:hypothetical protein
MTATDRRILKPALLAISLGLMLFALALALLAANGPPSASADGSDVKIEETCGPYVFRPNEWVVYQCLIRATNTGDEPARDIVTTITGSSGIILDAYFILFEVDGSPLPIEPTAKSFSAGGELAPGVTANVRLLVLLKTTSEGAYDAVWTTRANGDVVFTDPIHYEARDDAEAPPTGLSVEQVGRSRGRQAIFTTTITNHSSSSVTRLLLMEHYGPNGVEPAGSSPREWEYYGGANLAKWDLSAFGLDELAPGETLSLETTYESRRNCYVQSGVLVEATVDGEQQLHGASAGSASAECSGDVALPAEPAAGGDEAGSMPLPSEPPATGNEAVRAPATGEGPSSTSIPVAAYAALAVTGVAVIGGAQLVRRRVHHG